MQIIKFHQIKTNELVYVVIGAKSKNEAYHFVRNYKKMKLVDYHVINGKFIKKNNEYKLYTTALNEIRGTNCYIVARTCVELNPVKIYA